MKKPVILHCINHLGLGGAEILLKNTVKQLDCYDHVICYLKYPHTLATAFNSSPVYHLNYTSFFKSFQAIQCIRKIIERHNVDVVHSHLFYSTLLARFACARKSKLVFTVHNILSKDAFEVNRLSLWAEKLTYKKRHTVVGVSGEVLNDYNSWVGIKGKSFVLYNYVDEQFFNLSRPIDPDISSGLRLIAVGNLRRQKNYHKLIEAFTLLKTVPISLDIYGAGDLEKDLEKELLYKINEGRLNIRLMGRIDNVADVLSDYHAYIMPSLFEGFGIAPMEAMAAGMPVLLSDLPVFKEIAEDLPVYFNPTSSSSIANAILYVYNNWTEVISNVNKGRELIKSKASRDVYVSKLIRIYNS